MVTVDSNRISFPPFLHAHPTSSHKRNIDTLMAGRRLGARNATEPLERRVLLSTIDHTAVSATVGGFPAGGTDITLNGSLGNPTTTPRTDGIVLGAKTTNTPPITNALQLTDNANGLATSAMDKTVQGVDTFHTAFDFTFGNTYSDTTVYQNGPGADGFTFVLQNDPAKDTAVFGGGSNLGFGGMANSVAVKFDLWDNDEQLNAGPINSSTGVYVEGDFPNDVPRIVPSTKPIVVRQGNGQSVEVDKKSDGTDSGVDWHTNPNDIYHVDLNYDGTTLMESITDTTSNITITQAYLIDIPFLVGGHTAYAGFTAATGGGNAEQDIVDWEYTGTAGTGGIALPLPNFGAGSDANAGTARLYFNDAGAANVTGFEIDSSTGGGPFSKLADVAGTATNFTATGLDPTKTYQFEVKALGDGKASSDSPFSTPASVTPTGSQPIDFSGGFPSASGVQLNLSARLTGNAPIQPPAPRIIPANALELTQETQNRAGSAYATAQQVITKFDTSFDFLYPELFNSPGEGFTFVIQQSPMGLVALGNNADSLGYASTTTPITNSVAIKFDINDGLNNDATGLFSNGHNPRSSTTAPDVTVDMSASGMMLAVAGDDYHVELTYDGTTLHEEVDDVTAIKTFTHDYTVDIPTIIGGNVAWVGFTGSTSGNNAEQVVTKWTFTGAGGGPTDVINDPAGANTITLKQDADHTHIDWTLGAHHDELPINDAKGLTINNTSDSADTIVLNSSNGDPLPNLLKLNGPFGVNGFSTATTPINGSVDIQGSQVKVNYSGGSLLSALQAYLKGGKIFSSTLASEKLAIADVDAGSAVLLQPAIKGDVNLGGKVDLGDFLTLARNYGKTGADWSMGDFDYDAKVDFGDLVALARNYGGTGPTTATLTPAVSSDTVTLPKSRRPLSTRF